jgi:transposase
MSKERKTFSKEEKLQYAKMVVEDGYTIAKVASIADSCTSAVGRWKRQYLEERRGITSTTASALSPEHQEIQRLRKALARSQRDNDILKKAAALFVKDM